MGDDAALLMNPLAVLSLADARWSANYIVSTKDTRASYFHVWRNRQRMLDEVLNDDFSRVGPSTRKPNVDQQDGTLRVQNVVKSSYYDTSRLVAESRGTVKIMNIGTGEPQRDEQRLSAAIAETYHIANHDERKTQAFAGDVWGHSFAAMLHVVDPKRSPYPIHLRLNPRGCLPNIIDDKLIDLIYMRTLPAEQADGRWPDLNLLNICGREDQIEIVEFFDEEQSITVLKVPRKSRNGQRSGTWEAFTVQVSGNGGMIPVSWCRFDTGDGRFDCPVLDGAATNDLMNQVAGLEVDILEQAAYSSVVTKGLMKPLTYGPFSEIPLDPQVANASVERLAPAPVPQGLPVLQSMWERQARASVSEPQQREGEIPGSIYSGSAIGMSTGAQTSLVRSIQRELGFMRERGIDIDFHLDRNALDMPKPLLAGAGSKMKYLPSRDIPELYFCEVEFGVAAGLDTRGAIVIAQQLVGNQMASLETARTWVPGLGDTGQEETRVMRQNGVFLLFQGVMADPDPMAKYLFVQQLNAGADPLDAVTAVVEYKQQQAEQLAQQQQQMAAAGGQPGAPPGPIPSAQTQNTSLAQGGVPGTAEGQAPQGPVPQVPNLSQILSPGALGALPGGTFPGPPVQPIPLPLTQNLVR